MKKVSTALIFTLLCLFCNATKAKSDSSFAKIVSVTVIGNQTTSPPQYITASKDTTYTLAYDKNYLLFHFVNTQNSAQKSFSYKLVGLDYEWSACNNCSEVQYAHLDGGEYTFMVKPNQPNAVSAQFKFVIDGDILHKWWFVPMLFLYVLILIGVVAYLFIFYQFRQKLNEQRLIHTEKMASMAELTSGIAHEIQNPLNFVNNFSELSVDLAKELKEELDKINMPDGGKVYIDEILNDLNQNQSKIQHHGHRASNIVKGMLEHSAKSSGLKEPTNINFLIKETLLLSYHNMKIKNKVFSEEIPWESIDYPQGLPFAKMDLDESIGKVNVVPQDMMRVLLNLFNNAFYAVHQQKQNALANNDVPSSYTPSVLIRSKRTKKGIEISVKDNGTGMSESVRAKVFQPFFTTKPTGQGTGLGLSLAYDIVTKGHGGTLDVLSTEGIGSEFIITLPFKTNGK